MTKFFTPVDQTLKVRADKANKDAEVALVIEPKPKKEKKVATKQKDVV